ncbi:hypothetical protein [Streptomyces sp. AK04-3B]|uniref:hypothetical protein n=1 Tax=unclassified Streptomyces TaxID=2593676 RepID=UPI0039F59B34
MANCSTAAAADVRRWTWPSSTCQQWKLSPVQGSSVTAGPWVRGSAVTEPLARDP